MKDKRKTFQETPVNLLIVGATGSGKSSTINALFNTSSNDTKAELVTVGYTSIPKTKYLSNYKIGKINIWDTPGLGEGKQDTSYKNEIVNLLDKKNDDGYGLIDLTIVILDGSSKDIGTSLDIINNILIPHLGDNPEKRILIAINKVDLVKGGRYWDINFNQPNSTLEKYLNDMVDDIQSRIYHATSISIHPIVYSAGDKSNQQAPYNLLNFINNILINLPNEKRSVIVKETNINEKNWTNNKNKKNTESTTRKILREIFRTGLFAGVSSFFGGIFLFEL